MNKLWIGLGLVCLLISMSCSEEETPVQEITSGNGDEDDSDYKFLAFNITCYDDQIASKKGIMANVMVFNQETQKRVLSGSSSLEGYFCTIEALDPSIQYRVEIYNIVTSDCVMAFWDITDSNNPDCWVENIGDAVNASVNLGDCNNMSSTNVCWGD